MAVTNNAVTVTAGLHCSALSLPAIGQSGSGGLAYTDGHAASDVYVSVAVGATALNSSLGGAGFIAISNPTSGVDVSLLVAAQPLGVLPPGFTVVLPVATGIIINATVASSTQMVGVSAVRTSANA